MVAPLGWTRVSTGLPRGVVLALLGPRRGDRLRANFVVQSRPLQSGEQSDTLLSLNEADIVRHRGHVESATHMTIDHHLSGRIYWTLPHEGEAVRFLSVYTIADGTLYTFTAVARMRAFAFDGPAVLTMLNSIRFSPSQAASSAPALQPAPTSSARPR